MSRAFDDIAARLKSALGVKADSQVAAALRMSANNYANYKKAGSVPFGAIVTLAADRGFSLDYLLLGRTDVKSPESAKDELIESLTKSLHTMQHLYRGGRS